ncbi:MAG TPA: hypothetical protein VNO17_01580 [Actinomycetota bacterium]|nr:hypothetical protein [Actinomycetota bacterium]
MARGRIPKGPEKLGHGETRQETVVDPTARPRRTPPLPGARGYSEATRRWYDTWRRSPQATRFLPTDWVRLHMLAPLVERYFTGGHDPRLLAEIRLNEEKLGATVLDRIRLRLRVEDEAPGEPPEALGRNRRRPDPRRLAVVSALPTPPRKDA